MDLYLVRRACPECCHLRWQFFGSADSHETVVEPFKGVWKHANAMVLQEEEAQLVLKAFPEAEMIQIG